MLIDLSSRRRNDRRMEGSDRPVLSWIVCARCAAASDWPPAVADSICLNGLGDCVKFEGSVAAAMK